MTEILPCPFCSEMPILTKHFKENIYGLTHRCKIIGGISFEFGDKDAHIKNWNQRAQPDQGAIDAAVLTEREGCALECEKMANEIEVNDRYTRQEFGVDVVCQLRTTAAIIRRNRS